MTPSLRKNDPQIWAKISPSKFNSSDQYASSYWLNLGYSMQLYNVYVVWSYLLLLCMSFTELTIKKHPEDLEVESGGNAVLEVEAEGRNLTYQWYRDGQQIQGNRTITNKNIIIYIQNETLSQH